MHRNTANASSAFSSVPTIGTSSLRRKHSTARDARLSVPNLESESSADGLLASLDIGGTRSTDELATLAMLTPDQQRLLKEQENQFRYLLEKQQDRLLSESSARFMEQLLPAQLQNLRHLTSGAVPVTPFTSASNVRADGSLTPADHSISPEHSLSTSNTTVISPSGQASRVSSPKPGLKERSIKDLIGPLQSIAHHVCKALSLPPAVFGMARCLIAAHEIHSAPDGEAQSLELVLAVIWCGVSAYLSYAFIDGLMLRWLVMYSSRATILRLLSINALMAFLINRLLFFFAQDPMNLLSTWVLIACILTAAYAIQNFVTSNIGLEPRERKVDLYHIAVFAVVPVGLASFFTMIGLIRSLFVVRRMIAAQKERE
ncbi:N-glycosylation protein-domain-containing protein [Lipomyces oligophaga]|uniref:N-glycosylation protein-domain-containing protein n=1 Tax=Lipomyces oligophaga TaxID=45792 RepID=UPI0034CEDEA5